MTSAHHPQTNMTERINRTLKTTIASYVGNNHKHWDKHLLEFCFTLNSAVHRSTGVTPAELNLGWALQRPTDALLQPWDATPDSPNYKSLYSRTSHTHQKFNGSGPIPCPRQKNNLLPNWLLSGLVHTELLLSLDPLITILSWRTVEKTRS